MGDYLDSVLDKTLAFGEGFYVENKDRSGWYLFDITKIKDTTQYIWSKQLNVCLGWTDEETWPKLLINIGADPKNFNIKKIKSI